MRTSPIMMSTSLSRLITVALEGDSYHHVEIELEAAYKVVKRDNRSQVAILILFALVT